LSTTSTPYSPACFGARVVALYTQSFASVSVVITSSIITVTSLRPALDTTSIDISLSASTSPSGLMVMVLNSGAEEFIFTPIFADSPIFSLSALST